MRLILPTFFHPEYDDYYGSYDEDDFDQDAFEAQYLNTGIDLKVNDSNSTSRTNTSQQIIADDALLNAASFEAGSTFNHSKTNPSPSCKSVLESLDDSKLSQPAVSNDKHLDNCILVDGITSDLTRIAIQHFNEYQWQLPLMEMDEKFREETYYKHYTDHYISSLRSKLGHFLANHQIVIGCRIGTKGYYRHGII